ncbi:MAG: HEAT repeat domain-containing protein [Prochlorotrichaceae cyanobacterium]|jgi:HEAT repeat protein
MTSIDLEALAAQLESPHSRDRLIALASLRDVAAHEALPLIKKVIHDENIQIRSMAVFALGIKQTAENFDLLVNVLDTDSDYSIRASAAGALGYLEDARALEPLLRAFYEETDWLVRFSAAVSLGNLKHPKAEQALLEALESSETLLQQAAIAALGEIGAVEAVEKILRFANAEDWLVRQRLADALGNLPSPKTRSALEYLSKDSEPQVATAAKISLEKLRTLEAGN